MPAITLRIIAACVIALVAGADHLIYLVAYQKAGDRISPTFSGNDASGRHDPAVTWEHKFLARSVDRAAQETTAMKLVIAALATVFALSSPAFAQSSTDGLNGSTLGKSMRGVNNGVPYPNTNATDGTAGGGWRQHGTGTWKHHRHHRHHRNHWHHRHHRY